MRRCSSSSPRRRSRGVGMVEFALVAPILMLVAIGLTDVARVAQVNSAVADAARQAARQAAASDQETSPFGTYAASCSGQVLTANVSGTGCLSDTAVLAAARAVLKDSVTSANVTLYTGYSPDKCGTTSGPGNVVPPAAGSAIVCISQPQTGAVSGTAPTTCAAVWSATTYPAAGALGGRSNEFTSQTYKGCYLIQVTVVVTYKPWTPLVGSLWPSGGVVVRSTTATVAEY